MMRESNGHCFDEWLMEWGWNTHIVQAFGCGGGASVQAEIGGKHKEGRSNDQASEELVECNT